MFTDDVLRSHYETKVRNQELSLREFTEKKLVLASKPSKLILELAKYQFCRDASKDGDAMSKEVLKKVADTMLDAAYFVDVRGLERKTLAPRWHEILDLLEAHPVINWHMFTHLAFDDRSVLEQLVRMRFILGAGIDGISFETLQKVRKGSDFELNSPEEHRLFIDNIKFTGQKIAADKTGLLYFIVSIRAENVHELPAILELAREARVYEVQFKMLQHFSDMKNHEKTFIDMVNQCLDFAIANNIKLTLNDQIFLNIFDLGKIARAAKALPPPAQLNFPLPDAVVPDLARKMPWQYIDAKIQDRNKVSVYKKCFKPFHFAHITPQGLVGTCNHMLDPDIQEMGDLNKSGFEEIWSGKNYQGFRQKLLDGQPDDPRCQWCFAHRISD